MSGYRDTWFDNNDSNYGWYTCVFCGRKFRKGDIDIDHIIPQNRGGSDSEWNLQCACKHCNRSKQDSMDRTVPDLVRNADRIITKKSEKNPITDFLFKKRF